MIRDILHELRLIFRQFVGNRRFNRFIDRITDQTMAHEIGRIAESVGYLRERSAGSSATGLLSLRWTDGVFAITVTPWGVVRCWPLLAPDAKGIEFQVKA